MKTQLYSFLFIISIALLTGCSNDENDSHEKTIYGTWNLVNVRGGFADKNVNYSKGKVIWIFNQDDSTLSVQNNIGNDKAFMLHSGSYDFTIEQSGETQIIYLNGDDHRMVILSVDNSLIVTDDLLDGYTAEFQR